MLSVLGEVLLGVDIKNLKPNLDFSGAEWFFVILGIILGIGFLMGLVAVAVGLLRGGFAAIRGKKAGLGDLGWGVGVGFAVMIGCTFFGVLVVAYLALFPSP